MPQDRKRHAIREALVVLLLGALLLAFLEAGGRGLGLGAPDVPSLPPKQDGAFRIVALGGSTVQGVPDGRFGFVAQLDAQLSRLARGRRVDVRNLARAGLASRDVRALTDVALDASPDLVVVLTGHNEFLAPVPTRGLRGLLQRIRDRSHLVRALSVLRGAPDPAPADPLPEHVDAVAPDGPLRAQVEAAYRDNLAAIVDAVTTAGVPLYLCTAPSNRSEWPPAHRRVGWPAPRPDLDDAVRRIRAALAEGRSDAAAARARDWLAEEGDDAIIHYLLGRARVQGSEPDAARANFDRAVDLDPVPRRAFPGMNDAVRAHADRPGVRVVDVERLFAARARRGLVGFALVCDNCHPTPWGHALIAHEIARAMAEDGLLLDADAATGRAEAWLADAQRRIGDAEQRRRTRVAWLLSNAVYAMKTPFFNYEASARYLERARTLAPGEWRVHANLGTLAILEGRLEDGKRALARAARLKGSPLDPADRSATPYLPEALARLEGGGS